MNKENRFQEQEPTWMGVVMFLWGIGFAGVFVFGILLCATGG